MESHKIISIKNLLEIINCYTNISSKIIFITTLRKQCHKINFSVVTYFLLQYFIFNASEFAQKTVIFYFIFNWRKIPLQCYDDFCHTTTQISHNSTYIPSLPSSPVCLTPLNSPLPLPSHT